MKKTFLFLAAITIFSTSGCQALQNNVDDLKNKSEKTIDQASEQAENAKNKLIQAQQKYAEKSQQLINASDAIEKLSQ